jgi:hypothetical protein
MSTEVTLTAYNVKTKEKNVKMHDAIITKTAKGAYMAQGNYAERGPHLDSFRCPCRDQSQPSSKCFHHQKAERK